MRRASWIAFWVACRALVWAADAPEAIFRRAEQLDEEGKTIRAMDEYQAFLKAYPDHSQAPEAYYRLAKAQDAVGHVDEAVANLEKATEARFNRFRKRQDALYLLGKLLGDIKEHERAVKAFERLLAEGAGLYEEEALNLCGGYYAVLKKYDDAAAKFNLLKRRPNSRFAERAAYKLALLWLEARNLELAVEAVSDLATRYPDNPDARGLMLRLAEVFREQRRFDQAIAVCEQLRTKFADSREGHAAPYVIGLCHRDRKNYRAAVESLEAAARDPENVKSGLAADAMLVAADLYLVELNDRDKAMGRYEEAAGYAREYGDTERKGKILEQCYFRLAEHAFEQKKWAVALEFYSLLRKVGTSLNILPRIMKCQSELNVNPDAFARRDEEVAYIRKKIEENPGTFAAAEGEVFLADRELDRLKGAAQGEDAYRKVIQMYEDILRRYGREIVSQYHLESYVHAQLGHAHAAIYNLRRQVSKDAEGWEKAVAEFQAVTSVDRDSPYRQESLEWIAHVADAADQKKLAFDTYRALYEMAGDKYRKNEKDPKAQEEMTDYLRGMLSRAREGDSIDTALSLSRKIIEEQGLHSAAARHAFFYTGELHYLRKDFSAAAKTYRDFVRTYGPSQNAEGNLADGPWKVENPDEKILQVYEAAVRVAQAWYLQGHTQNMLQAYKWIATNFPNRNVYLAEARYWLAMELAKGKDAGAEEKRREMAVAMWTGVVAPWSLDVPPEERSDAPPKPGEKPRQREKAGAANYHFWIHDRQMSAYARAAIVKTGELLSGLKEHKMAAEAFRTYLDLYPPAKPRHGEPPPPPDDLYYISRYMLGQEQIALSEIEAMTKAYKPFLTGERTDRFRLAALRFMGFHASSGEWMTYGVEAYATILDEYGTNEKDVDGKPIPIPVAERIRQGDYGWDGIRMPPPQGLDLGQVRYALGFLYWKNGQWAECIRALLPFAKTADLITSKSRDRALYMVAQSYYRTYDFASGINVLWMLVTQCPTFEAIEEAYAEAGKGCVRTRNWKKMDEIYARFMKEHPASSRRPHMDLYAAIAATQTGRIEEGARQLKGIARSDAYEDVKADAYYQLGLLELATPTGATGGATGGFKPELAERNYRAALADFEKSIELYPREQACLAAARACVSLGEWDRARSFLNRALSDFAEGDRATIEEAKSLLQRVLKEAAKEQEKGK